jgi:hypothetical protein
MTTTYQRWEDQLNNFGIYAELEKLTEHLTKAPTASNKDEINTINLVKKVIETRSSGGDITKIFYK